MERQCFALLCAVLAVSGVHHVMGAENLTVGTVPDQPWAYAIDGENKGLAVEILQKVFTTAADLKDDYSLVVTEMANGVVGDASKGLVKAVVDMTDDIVIGAAGIVATDAIKTNAKLGKSAPFLTFNVGMIMQAEEEDSVKTIVDAKNNNMTFIAIKGGPIHKLFSKCDILVTDNDAKEACKAINTMLATNTKLPEDAETALKQVKDHGYVWLTDGGCATYFTNNRCGFKWSDGSMFAKDTVEYIFIMNKAKSNVLKSKIDKGITALKTDISTMADQYLKTMAKTDKTCGASGLSFTIISLLLSIFVSKLL